MRDALSQCSVTQKAPKSTAEETPLAPADELCPGQDLEHKLVSP